MSDEVRIDRHGPGDDVELIEVYAGDQLIGGAVYDWSRSGRWLICGDMTQWDPVTALDGDHTWEPAQVVATRDEAESALSGQAAMWLECQRVRRTR